VAPPALTEIEDARLQAALAPADPYWPFHLAELHLADGALAEAETALVASIALDSTYTPSLSLLSKLYFDAGRHREAVEMLEALRARPDRFPGGMPRALLEGLALHYDALDEVGLAEAVMAELTRRDADRVESSLVYLTLRGAKPETAELLASEALKKDSRSAVNHNNYGITRLRAGDLTAARQAFLTAVEIDPSLPGPYYNLAILEKFYVFDETAAAEWFRQYRARSLDDPDGLFEVFGEAGSHASREGDD
jgi:tetratricopeptide (TPR) repeat protein